MAEKTVEETKLKSAFIGQFSQFISWPTPLKHVDIAYLGDDDAYWQSLNDMALNIKQAGPFKLSRLSTPREVNSTQMDILVVDKSRNELLPQLQASIEKRPILLITENVTDNKLIGINFFKTANQTLSFKLNRYNLLYQGLKIDKNIVLLGGSEIDVANMVKEMSFKLSESSQLIDKLNERINSQNKNIAEKQLVINQKQLEINEKNSEYEKLIKNFKQVEEKYQNALAQLEIDLNNSQQALDKNTLALEEQQTALTKIASDKTALNLQVKNNQQRIQEQLDTLKSLEGQLSDKEKALLTKEQQVQTTTHNLMLSLLGLLAFAILAISLWYFNKKKHTLNQILASHNQELEEVNLALVSTQKQLVESEKMASLGGIVTGVAHEVNTPLGSAITAISHLSEITTDLFADFKDQKLSSKKFELVLNEQIEATNIVFKNLCRAAELIKSFKQVSVDQVSEMAREFEIVEYLNEVVISLRHQIKRQNIEVEIICDSTFVVYNYPGVISQIFTNLIINSITHGFKENVAGKITITISEHQQQIHIDYLDNGIGIDNALSDKIFDPFFTTNRHAGSTGLGLSICYNLTSQKLKGSIQLLECDSGAHFQVQFPKRLDTASK
ncbi:YfiR/HmsC family protein [Pseudoalteromonas sp. SSM20]|uniref:YfiR/HmsC family protein n=1 Tax=Pseudoalteromonas sp. SSM20 TaxID=3139394 RepID=UPI003BAD3E69